MAVSLLAEGGMGSIYLGRRISVGSGRRHDAQDEVVLKQLPAEHSHDPKMIELFVREAKLAASLSHHNIVRIFDLVNADDEYYIVMEYVRGGDLRTILRRARRRHSQLSLDSTLFIVSEVLAALAYAHEQKGVEGRLVHRDVSPSNILLGASGTVKLTDFGIAKSPTQNSVVYRVKGKVGYMAPEQARGEKVDRRVDLFAAGVVLYELLVGERLFVGNALQSPSEIFAQPVRPPSRRRADVGTELDAIVLRALALDRDGRFESAVDMRRALLDVAKKSGRTLSERKLAEDLAETCGVDPSTWLSLDVPMGATLGDGHAPDGTGVILTDDDEELDRPSTRSMPLPVHELTSVVRLKSGEDFDPPPTVVEATFPPIPESEFDADDAATRVRKKDSLLPPLQLDSRGSRALFEVPVPRSSVPPPSVHDVPVPVESDRTQPEVTRPEVPHAQSRPPSLELETTAQGRAMFVPAAGSGSATASEALARDLGTTTTLQLVVRILVVLVVIALGIGLGVWLSGDSPPPAVPIPAPPASAAPVPKPAE